MPHILIWWALLEALGLLLLPFLYRLFSAASGFGYPFAKILSILLITFVSWIVASAGVLPFHLALYGTLGVLVLLSLWRALVERRELAAWWREGGGRQILLHDGLWTAGFLFFVYERSLAPDIFGAEKYMDFAFLNTLTRTDVMPPIDPWMAGKVLNYYYFGYLTFANLVRLSGIPSHIAYNLCIATVGGLGFSEFSALGLRLTGRFFFGLLSGLAALVLGNLDGAMQVWEHGALTPIDYWRSSRIVAHGDTINEFPFFSTIHGDLHPHFMVLPVTGLLLAILLDRKLFPRREDFHLGSFRDLVPLALVSFVFGAMLAISTWELPVGALLIFLLIGRDLPLWPLLTRARLQMLVQFVAVMVSSIVLFLPFYLNFQPPTGGGPGFKVAQTSIVEFLIVFAALLLPLVILAVVESRAVLRAKAELRQLILAASVVLVIAAALAGNAVIPLLLILGVMLVALHYRSESDEWRAPLNLAIVASIALLACEFAFLRDSYGEKLYRMNTVFKLYFQAWLLLSLAAPWALSVLLTRRWAWRPASQVVAVATGSLLVATCAYPIGLTLTRMGSPWPRTLDGTAYLQREHPDDFAAIAWLRDHVKGVPVILETSGNPYSYYARFSANTGLPTVLGWGNHEGLWRSDHGPVDQRRHEVDRLYDSPSLEAINPLLDELHIEYIVVGELERKDHRPEALEKFAQLPIAFQHGKTVIYQRGS